jgi:hypothetical protein
MPALADARNCGGIHKEEARRTCQTQVRRDYSGALERRLSEIGPPAQVIPEETGDPQSGAYPRLIVWTPLTKDRVYQLIDQAQILDAARHVGFRMVVFVEKGLRDYWYFDLTKPGTVALDVLPPQTPPWARRP